MRLGLDEYSEPRSTPKLSLSRLPCKPKQPLQMLTPPLHPSAAVPFQWEEAPGKPRLPADAPPSTTGPMCLELPPGLLHDGEVTIMPSPMMVVGGPYAARSLSLECTFPFRRGPGSGSGSGSGRERMGGCGRFGSRRWRSWRYGGEEEKVGMGRGSFDLSHTLGEFFKSERRNGKMRGGIGRVRSFFHFSSVNSNLLDFCSRFKQAIPWRRR